MVSKDSRQGNNVQKWEGSDLQLGTAEPASMEECWAWGHEKVLTCPLHDLCFGFLPAHLQTTEMLCSVIFL